MNFLLSIIYHTILFWFNKEYRPNHIKILIFGLENFLFHYDFMIYKNDKYFILNDGNVICDSDLELAILKLNKKLNNIFGREIYFIKCYW